MTATGTGNIIRLQLKRITNLLYIIYLQITIRTNHSIFFRAIINTIHIITWRTQHVIIKILSNIEVD